VESLRQRFSKLGYAHVQSVLDPAEVRDLRDDIEVIFSASGPSGPDPVKRRLTPHEVLEHPSLYRLPFLDRVVSALREILAPYYVMIGDLSVHRNLFGASEPRRWHTDSVAERNRGYLLRRDYRFVNCGIFLQRNTRDYGGGISVLPGGHRYRFRTFVESVDHQIQDRITSRAIPRRAVMLPIEPGDFVAFHSRLPHAATFPERLGVESNGGTIHVPAMPRPELNKYVLYFSATNKREFADRYLASSEHQAEGEAAPTYVQDLFYMDYLRLAFPSSYPAQFVREARERRVQLASLPFARAERLSETYAEHVARRALAT